MKSKRRIQLDFYPLSLVIPHHNLDAQYQILEHIATGGMAEVYKAKLIQPNGFSKIVVIKKIIRRYEKDQRWIDSFFREAKMMSTLNHSNITHIYHLGDIGGDSLVMEFVEGGSLYDLKKEAKIVPMELVSFIAVEILKGLGYAHKKGVLHRDLSPSNILISAEGEIKITDFGIARYRDCSERTVGSFLNGGKPGYMSPESKAGGHFTESSDLYSVALILYELLNGKKYENGDQLIEHYPALKKALNEQPQDRFATAEEFEEALRKEWGPPHVAAREFAHYLSRYRPWAQLKERTLVAELPSAGPVARRLPSALLLRADGGSSLLAPPAQFPPHASIFALRKGFPPFSSRCMVGMVGRSLLLILLLLPFGMQPPEFCPHGYLSLNVRPWAKIYAEDQTYLGMTPIVHRMMPIGKYRLQLTHPDLKKTKTIFIEIKANEALKLSLKL